MSEEKMYAVKNDEGKYWDFGNSGFWRREFPDCLTTTSRKQAGLVAFENGGHVVTLIEEPEKVVLSKEQAEIVENAHDEEFPATYISDSANLAASGEEDLLMNAYVSGWTVEKPKRYVLPMPGTDYHNNQMNGNAQYYAVKGTGNWRPDAIALGTDDAVKHGYTVTKSDIDDAPDWVKTITPVEVTDDGE
ncbi:DUF1642 domain-containing protein [Loigolactobacillus backii]|uniref:DUF1642 domain-containing protein n=1 Tax=Loigolactobacillus backii TaxID=375175 RepID=UPI0022FD420D|nr:DUF1642 domain-containing protein [Loigolactobacillus backii]MDA5386502.1 DUF1642 domain-containing protein [Loigolactobacillus backii]MDA5389029.1 DUF1642 domain-containing protein [Loigolactobacillus backii]